EQACVRARGQRHQATVARGARSGFDDGRHGSPAPVARLLYAGAMTAHDPPSDPEWQWLPWSPGQAAEPVVRAWLGQRLGVAADKLRIERDLHGRPRLASHPGADASWSHSGDGLVAAMARGARRSEERRGGKEWRSRWSADRRRSN